MEKLWRLLNFPNQTFEERDEEGGAQVPPSSSGQLSLHAIESTAGLRYGRQGWSDLRVSVLRTTSLSRAEPSKSPLWRHLGNAQDVAVPSINGDENGTAISS